MRQASLLTEKLIALAAFATCILHGQNAQEAPNPGIASTSTALQLFCSIAPNNSLCQTESKGKPVNTFYGSAVPFLIYSGAANNGTPGLSIGNYQQVGSQRVANTQQFITFTADLTNDGPALPEATATVTSLSPSIQVVPGQATLHFPAIPANGHATSRDTFTILVDNDVPYSFSGLQWSFLNPVANPGPNQTVAVGSKVTLDGSGSSNPSGGGALTYLWSFTSVPAGSSAVIANSTTVMPSFTVDISGDYIVTLTVSNELGSRSASVTVSTVKSSPVAIAGPNQAARVRTQVKLNGSASFDVDGDLITYLWSLISAPLGSQARLTNGDSVSPTFVPDIDGTYIVQLVVNNGKFNSNPATVIITTGNTPPVANAGPSQLVNPGSLAQLSGSGSSDADGDPLTFKWSLISIPANSRAALNDPSAVNPAFTVDVPGTYVAQLLVNDGTIEGAPSTTTITTDRVLAPTANAGSDQTVLPRTTATLSGSGSDPQQLSLTMRWSLISKPSGSVAVLSSTNTPNPTFFTDFPGTYVAQLIVSNAYASSVPSTVVVTTTKDVLPVASAGPNQNVPAGATVTLNGSGSTDANSLPLTYLWSLISVPTASSTSLVAANTAFPTFAADVPGTYVVQLIVNNGLNRSRPATVTITASGVTGMPAIALTPSPLTLTTGPGTLTLTLNPPAGPSGQVVTFTGFDPAIISLPSSVIVPAKSATTTVIVTPLAVGTSNVVGSARGYTPASATVVVAAALGFTPQTLAIRDAITQNLTISLSMPAPPGGAVVNLSASPTGIITIPESVRIAQNATTATVPVTAATVGKTIVTASSSASNISSGTATVTVQSIQSAGVIALPANVSVGPGQTATFAVTLPSAPTQAVTVTLSSSDSSKLSIVPASVTIAAGQTQPATQAQITGLNFGTATIIASAQGYTTGSQTVRIGAMMNFRPNNPTITGTATQELTLTLSAATPAALAVNLTATPAGVVVMPATVSIAANSTTATVTLAGANVGTTNITASTSVPNVSSAIATVTVQSAGTITLPSRVSIRPGQTATFAVTLPSAPTQPVTVMLSSSDLSVVTLSPASVTIAAGQTQPATQAQITGVNFGTATISASAPGYTTGNQNVNVAAALGFTSPNVSVNGPETQNLILTLSAPAPTAMTVNVSTNPTGIVTTPASVTIAQNSTKAALAVTGAAVGTTTVTASTLTPNVAGGTTNVTVLSAGAITLASSATVASGQSVPLAVGLSAPAPQGGVVVTLSSSDSTIIAISPGVVSIAAGQTQPAILPQMTGKNLGRANITASSPLYTPATEPVQSFGTIRFLPASLSLAGGDTQNLMLTLSGPAPAGGITFSVTSSRPSVAVILASTFTIPANSTTVPVPISGVVSGISIIRASAPNMADATAIITVAPRVDIIVPAAVTVAPGSAAPFAVSLVNLAQSDVVINLTSSDPGTTTVSPSIITIAAGQTEPTQRPSVSGIATGQVTITASATGLTPATSLVFVAPLDIILPDPFALAPGDLQTFPVSLAKPAQSPVTISLTSSDPTVATVLLSTLSIDAGQTAPRRQPNISGSAPGRTTITATATGLNPATSQVTVGVTATLSPPNLTVFGITGQGTLGITLSFPAPRPITFTLTSDNPDVATAPPSVVMPLGAQVIGFKVTGAAAGKAIITATAPGLDPMSSNITVQPAGSLAMSASSSNIQLLQSAAVTFTLSPPAPAGGINISLSSGSSTVALSSSLIFVAAGLTSATAQITGMDVGSATISATAQGYSSPPPIVVMTGATIQWVTPALTISGSVQRAYLYLKLSAAVPQTNAGIPITLTSSRPDVASVPASSNFIWDGSNAPTLRIQVDRVGPGTTIIHAGGTNIPGVDATVTVTGPLVISTTSLVNGNVGVAYSATVTAAGGAPPYAWSATGLPADLSINASTGQITGIPAASGSSTVTVTVADASTPTMLTAKATFGLTITASVPASISVAGGSPQSTPVMTAFAGPLSALVQDATNSPLPGVVVTFTAPGAGPSGTFAGGANTAITNVQGIATSTVFTANGVLGNYSVSVSVGALSTNFSLRNTVGPPAKIAVSSGSGQSALINTVFPRPLAAVVTDAGGNAVPNVTVTFTAPSQTEASITFAGGRNTAVTNASGVATSAAITANARARGPYSVVASSGTAPTASFALTNTPGPAAQIAATTGSGQTASVNTLFLSPLVATVTDTGGNPVPNAAVTFTTPRQTGPSVTFAGGVNTAVTNSSGAATSAPISANGHAGAAYSVVASSGDAATAGFILTNTLGVPATIVVSSGAGQTAKVNTAFAGPLVALVTDSGGNPIANAKVAFIAPAPSGASLTFAGGINTATTDAQGLATSAAMTSNGVSGSYNVVASSGTATAASFGMINIAGPPAKIVATSGNGQSAGVNSVFAIPFGATVTDANDNPVPNLTVTFTAPLQSGPSITFAGGVNTAITNSSGVATSAAITANPNIGGPYNVVASAGTATTATFVLTNTTVTGTTIAVSSGGGQSAQINTAFASPLVATVTDRGGNPVGGAIVTFSAPPESGPSVKFAGGVNTVTTNNSGVASLAGITANSHAGGPYNVVASAGSARTASFILTNNVGPVASIVASAGSGQSARTNSAFSNILAATVTDAGGNPIPNVTVTFTSPAQTVPSVTFAGGVNTATTDASGVATSAVITANGHAGGPYNISASCGAVTVLFVLTNTPGPAAKIVVSGGSGQSVPINTAFANPLVATVTDAAGNPVSGLIVTFAAPAQSGPSVTFAGDVNTAITSASGIATSPAITANSHAGGPYNIVASSGTAATGSFALTNAVGGAANIVASAGSGQSAVVNTAFANPLTATITDVGGNPVPNVTVTFIAPGQTAASVTFAAGRNSATTNAQGMATSPVITANGHLGGPYNVAASAGIFTTNFTLTNTSGPPATIVATSGSGQNARTNTAFTNSLVVTVTDAAGNPAANATVTFTAPSQSGPSAIFAGGVNTATVNAQGVATSGAISANTKAGMYNIVASSGTATVANFTLTNTPGPPTSLTVASGSPQQAPVNTVFPNRLQVAVKDANNNGVSGVTVTFTVPASGASGAFAGGNNTAVTDGFGIATSAVFTAGSVVGTYAVTAAAAGLSTTLTLGNVAGPPALMTITSGSPQTATVNTAFAPLQVRVTDVSGNPIRATTITFTAPPSGPSGTFAGNQNTAVTDSNGTATSAQFAANGISGSYTVVAAVSGVAVAASFQLTNAPTSGGPAISVTSATIGQNLEAAISITLNPTPPATGVPVTLTSSDSTLVLIGNARSTLSINITPGLNPFTTLVQALGSSGSASITVSAPGYSSAISTITLAPSGFVIAGSNGMGGAFSVFQGSTTPLTLYPGRLDPSGSFVEKQPIGFGLSAIVPVASSETAVGTVAQSTVFFNGGDDHGTVSFLATPAGTGTTTVSIRRPSGFNAPSGGDSVAITVLQPTLLPFTTTVGQYLQKNVQMSIGAASSTAVDLTLTSNDPSLMTFSKTAAEPGSTSITLIIPPGHDTTPMFYVQALGSKGSVGYTATSSVLSAVTGTVSLASSGLAIQSPGGFGAASFTAPLTSAPATIQVFTGLIDAGGNFVEQQTVAAGMSVSVSVVSTDTTVGTISTSPIIVAGGTDNASTIFQPMAQGTTTVTAASTGFASSQVAASVTAFAPPLLFSEGDTTIGQNLESQYTVTLPQNAGPAGLQITVLSGSPLMQVSATRDGAGSGSLVLAVAPNTRSATFYVQGRATTGTATLTATAAGFASATTSIQLAPAAIVLFPPTVSGTAGSTTSLMLFVALLDLTNTPIPTSQLLAGPLSANVSLSSSNQTVAAVPTSVDFQPGTGSVVIPITLRAPGFTGISLTEPSGFTVPNSHTSATVITN
jgi:hypothetical protein